MILARTRLHLVTFLVLFARSSGLVPLDVFLISCSITFRCSCDGLGLGRCAARSVGPVALLPAYLVHGLVDACLRKVSRVFGDLFWSGPVFSRWVLGLSSIGLGRGSRSPVMGSVDLSVQGVSTGERNCLRVTIPLCWKGSSDLQLP